MSITNPSVRRGRDDSLSQNQVGSVPATSGLTLVSESGGDGPVRTTVLKLTNFAITLADNGSTGSGGAKIYDFPAGAIQILGGLTDIDVTYGTVSDAGLIASVGTATAGADGTLTSTEANICVSTAAATTSGAGTANCLPVASPSIVNGTSAAADAFLNFATSSDPGTNNSITVSGYVQITWINHGDF